MSQLAADVGGLLLLALVVLACRLALARHTGPCRPAPRPHRQRAERAGLDWLPDDQRPARGRLTLWDGEAELSTPDVEPVDYDPREGIDA